MLTALREAGPTRLLGLVPSDESRAVSLTVIVPTLNEAENLPILLPRLDAALRGRTYEVVVVDDGSSDGTPDVCLSLARHFPLRLVRRDLPRDGLGGAVLEALRVARGDLLLVMDADLQHPPEQIPQLLAPLESGEADFVLGSRYVAGARTDRRWGALRRFNSRVATALARPFAGPTRDPMSGFFALPRSTLQRGKNLSPRGFKIALELMCKCRARRVREVPIHFAPRQHGRSKLTVREQFRFLEHLSRLYDFAYPRRSSYSKFIVVATLGFLIAALFMRTMLNASLVAPAALCLAYPATIAVTALFFLRYVTAQRAFIVPTRPWRDFLLISAAEWATVIGVTAWGMWRLRDTRPLELLTLAFAAAMIIRYVLRKELMHDIRGLRREPRREELG